MGKVVFSVFLMLFTSSVLAQSFHFDDNGMLTQVTYPDSTTIEYCYDELGNRTCYNITSNQVLVPDLVSLDQLLSNENL